jgi:SAM-dependent methyltransferase
MTAVKKLVPSFIRRPINLALTWLYPLRRLTNQHKSREGVHAYWQRPPDAGNKPEAYLAKGEEQSRFLVELVKRYVSSEAAILEIGCNAGRNLHHLYTAGFTHLGAIELSADAVALLRQTYPDMAAITIDNRPVETAIKAIADRSYDVVFTMAVLEHIHTESEWVFGDLQRVARQYIITIEDEKTISERHFPRNYRTIFETNGFRQMDEIRNTGVIRAGFVARVFQRG